MREYDMADRMRMYAVAIASLICLGLMVYIIHCLSQKVDLIESDLELIKGMFEGF